MASAALFSSSSSTPSSLSSPSCYCFHPNSTTSPHFSSRRNPSPITLLCFHRNRALSSKLNHVKFKLNCVTERATDSDTQLESPPPSASPPPPPPSAAVLVGQLWEWAVLVSPFFFWGTAMVAMKEVLPKTGPFFVSSFRLIPAGLLLVAFASSRGRPLPSGLTAWLSISLFALVDATCFQGFLAEGLERTSAGLGSVIIDSQPLTVAVLAALLFGESIGFVGAAGLVLGVIGLLLLEVPAISFDGSNFSLWGSGEWWMLLAAQSMAVGTVMVRWVTKYSDPIMATGWVSYLYFPFVYPHPILNNPYANYMGLGFYFVEEKKKKKTAWGSMHLLEKEYHKIVGRHVIFDNCISGSLTKLSSLTFLTPMFASIFGFLYLGETFTPVQLIGALVTLAAIYMVNYKTSLE
ncbi:WAT1-related protein At3g02690, chloroplastic [Camellia sinensis]|uniref:WAT1-related protein At3g02690, chloroplastic n=1 Tax=Camellia sinensis TaxID=4442 RepID=UPI001036F07E|nr:WAT1-related protein At3g02690, chloroplastic [Camellia sinensis]